MKRIKLIACCMLVLCSLLVLVNVGTIMASEPGYDITEYFQANPITVDGKWTNNDEWRETTTERMTPSALFEYKLDSSAGYQMAFLIEFADNTNDPGDKWEICFDGGAPGGSAPTTTCNKFVIEGHTTLLTYVGTGTGWALTANIPVQWANTIAASSPHDPAPHWILELVFDKAPFSWGAAAPPHGLRVACYDASNAAAGWQAWPPEAISKDNPTRWGVISTYSMDPAPEGLTIGVMVLLSSVAVLVSTCYFRKRQ